MRQWSVSRLMACVVQRPVTMCEILLFICLLASLWGFFWRESDTEPLTFDSFSPSANHPGKRLLGLLIPAERDFL